MSLFEKRRGSDEEGVKTQVFKYLKLQGDTFYGIDGTPTLQYLYSQVPQPCDVTGGCCLLSAVPFNHMPFSTLSRKKILPAHYTYARGQKR